MSLCRELLYLFICHVSLSREIYKVKANISLYQCHTVFEDYSQVGEEKYD